jgi:hypothetical protein
VESSTKAFSEAGGRATEHNERAPLGRTITAGTIRVEREHDSKSARKSSDKQAWGCENGVV